MSVSVWRGSWLWLQKSTEEDFSILEHWGRWQNHPQITDKKIKAQKNGAPQPGHGGWKGTIWGAYVSARDGWPEGRGTWGDPVCLLSLDWLRPMVSTNLSFLLCKWWMTLGAFQKLFIPRGQEEIVSGKAVGEDGDAQTFAQIAWNSMSRSNSRSLPPPKSGFEYKWIL